MTEQAQKPEFTLPSTPEEAKRAIAEMLEKGLVTPADLSSLSEGRRETGSAVFKVLEDGSPEIINEKPLTFAEAVPKLNEAGFDLEKARVVAVRMHEQWGLVKALQAKGVVQNADQYGALFDKATFTAAGLKKFTENLKQGQKWAPEFNPGNLSYADLIEVLKANGIRLYGYGAENPDELRLIDPKDIENLSELPGKSGEEQLEISTEAWTKGKSATPTAPKILFTPDKLEVTDVNKSASQRLVEAAEGAQFMDPTTDLIRWFEQRQRTGKYPDTLRLTQYPSYVYSNGWVADLLWRFDIDVLDLSISSPDFALADLGVRPVLG